MALALACAATQTRVADAHPHAWIDVRVTVLFGGDGAITGLRQSWLFDEFYTAFATVGLDGDGDGIPDPGLIDALSIENITNLADYSYFTSLWVDGTKQTFGTATEVTGRLAGDRYEMSFTAPLAAPVDPRAGKLTYAVYDPTYYVELLHAEVADAIVLDDAPMGCSFSLQPPNPDPDMVAFAASLSPTESGGDGLGILFAERVSLECTTGS